MGSTHGTVLCARHYFLCIPAPQQEIRGFWAVSLVLWWRDRPLWSLTSGHILFSLGLMTTGPGGMQQGPRREFYTRERNPIAGGSFVRGLEQGDGVPLQTIAECASNERIYCGALALFQALCCVICDNHVENPHHTTHQTEMLVIPSVQIRETEAQKEGNHKWVAAVSIPGLYATLLMWRAGVTFRNLILGGKK